MTILERIIQASKQGQKLLAVLIDPEVTEITDLPRFLQEVAQTPCTHIFVGGSTVPYGFTQDLVKVLKQHTNLPVLLFPGDETQITEEADGLLFLSLLSGDNPEYLVHQHVKAAAKLKDTSLEVIPTAYLLIDGGVQTSVQQVSQTQPIAADDLESAVNLAYAGQLMGKRLIYLEAGSGARISVSERMIQVVRKQVEIPLIVGGGIRDLSALKSAYQAGADMVVIGTAFENNDTFLKELQLKTLEL